MSETRDLTERQRDAMQAANDYTRALLAEQKPAITYLLYYPAMRDVARAHGYALTIHGSLHRDCDLVAVPWTDDATDAETLVAALCAEVQLIDTLRGAQDKPHGRRCWTLKGVAGLPHGWVDLSIMPRRVPRQGEGGAG